MLVTLDPERLADLRVFDADELREVVAEVIESTSSLLQSIADSVAAGATSEVGRAAHLGRNYALSVGATELAGSFGALESAARNDDAAATRAALERAVVQWPDTRTAISKIR
jgi:HPt (histidine-containing phosphotransfer) domain-containing protein